MRSCRATAFGGDHEFSYIILAQPCLCPYPDGIQLIDRIQFYNVAAQCFQLAILPRQRACFVQRVQTMNEKEDSKMGCLVNDTLREVMENSEDYFFVKDLELVYQGSSIVLAKMIGVDDPLQLIGKNDYDLFPREIAEKFRCDDTKVLESGHSINGMVEQLPDKNGMQRWTKTWKHAIHDENGKIIGLYGISRDISRDVELEKRAKTAEDYGDLINNIPGGIGILHVENDVVHLDFANEGCFEIQHSTREGWKEYMGPKIMDVVYEPDCHLILDEYNRIKNHVGEIGSATYRIHGLDKQLHWVNTKFRAVYEKAGIWYYYAVYSNLDSQKKIEEKLADSLDALQEAMSNSDIQFFTYFPQRARCEFVAMSKRLSELPRVWENFPDDFFEYTKPSPEDAEAFRAMLRAIDSGEDEAQCLVKLAYKGIYGWERMRLKAVRDSKGNLVRAQGYASNVTAQKNAEERLHREQVRLKTASRGIFESFTFNLTKASHPNIQTTDKAMLEGQLSEAILSDALRICPALADTNPATREVLLRAAARIPDPKEREKFILTCSGDSVRAAVSRGRYSGQIRYRRYVGDEIRWVSTSAEVLPDPGSGDLIAFYYTKDINDEVTRNLISQYIIEKNYASVSCLNLQSGIFSVLAGTDEKLWNLNGMQYTDAISAAAQQFVADGDIEAYQHDLALSSIIEALNKNPLYTVYNSRRQFENSLPGNPLRRMKNDIFYLDEYHENIVFLLTDVTAIFKQERESREKLETALAAAEQASIAKTEFLSRMSHEIRTPMNAIIGLDAIALQESHLSTSMVDHLQKMGIAARFLLSLINDILDMSRIESGRMILKNEEFNFEQMVDGINTILYEQCRDCGLDYECVLKSFTAETYKGDVTKLQQVLINLLGNAVKFTPRGGKIHFMIEQVSRTKDNARLRFEISDTGIGIDDKFIPHLFEAFSQENRGSTSPFGGTGLGLAISKNIVNLMNGKITVHSIKDVGSEFSVEVVLGLPDEAVGRQQLGQSFRPLFTLVVDDDIIVCQHTQMILSGAGLKAEYIDSGTGAVAKVKEQHLQVGRDYDLILLDWKMPDMDGIETAQEIRKIVGPEVTIIIMTAYDWADIEKKARAAGVDLFMKKPVFASSVTQAFENVLLRKGAFSGPSEQEITYNFSGKRILLAEDNTINAEIARHLLEMKGCLVEVALNGAEAVESFAAAPVGYFDAILMDVRMPVMDGLDATKAIRAMRKLDAKTVPILAMTANAFQEDVNASLASGMNAHLTKPIEPKTLYDTLRRYFDQPASKVKN